jgi:hypothetical protein
MVVRSYHDLSTLAIGDRLDLLPVVLSLIGPDDHILGEAESVKLQSKVGKIRSVMEEDGSRESRVMLQTCTNLKDCSY